MIPPPCDPVALERARTNSIKKREEIKHSGVFQRSTSVSIASFQPKIITENRRKIEDLCRDLVVNNDHIHVMEMRLRAALAKVSLSCFLFVMILT